MKLQEGKRYVRRDGQLSGVIKHNPFNHEYSFVDDKYHNTYTEKGKRFNNLWDHDSDLVSLHYEAGESVITEVAKNTEMYPSENYLKPYMITIPIAEYERFKAMESHLKQVTELWNEIQAEKA